MKKIFRKLGVSKSDVTLIVALVVIKGSIVDMNTIPSESMLPLMRVDDRVHIDKLAYSLRLPMTTSHLFRWDEPKRGEVVTFIEQNSRSLYIKRVIGVSGDTVEMGRGKISVNGVAVEQAVSASNKYSSDGFLVNTEKWGDDISYPVRYNESFTESANQSRTLGVDSRYLSLRDGNWVVPEGKLLVMGDNRDESYDSRFFDYTFVDVDSVTGKAKVIIGNFTPVEILGFRIPVIFSGVIDRWRSIYKF